jgi:hypothetical protein
MNDTQNYYVRLGLFNIKIKGENVTRFYKHNSKVWFKEIQYYEGTKQIKQITEVGKFNLFHKLNGFCVVDGKMIIFVNKKIKKYYQNGKIKSIELVGGEPNNDECDVLCGKQYYYRENGSREKILNYCYTRDYKVNEYNIIKSEGLHGVQLYYYDNNKIQSNEVYFLGSKHGWQFLYDKNGKLIEKQIFYDGRLSNVFKI